MTVEEQTRLYRSQRCSSSSNAQATSPNVTGCRGAAECRDMEAMKVNCGILDLGLDAGGKSIVISGVARSR